MAERTARPRVGWREWVVLDELGGARIKAKVDTGARTSSLHATDIAVDDGGDNHADCDAAEAEPEVTVSFTIHPHQHDDGAAVMVRAPLAGWRDVRSSNGAIERRVAITTTLRLGEDLLKVELTLTRRDDMGFRMLLGRSSVKGRYVVDPSRSFVRSGRRCQEGR